MRAVLDTDVMVAGMLSPSGASRRLIVAAADRAFVLLVSAPLMLEWEAVLKRPAVLAAAAASPEDVDVVLDQLALVAVAVEFHFLWRPSARDPDDDMLLETAINGQADAIVSFNVRDLAAGAAAFGVLVELPGRFLRRLR